jgi:hypothetical protein
MLGPYSRERIENWVGDFCSSDAIRGFSGGIREYAGEVLVQFMLGACEARDVEPQDLEESDVRSGLLGRAARLKLPATVRTEVPALCAAFLRQLEIEGRLGGGALLAAYARALKEAYEESASGKPKTIVRPGSRLNRNDPCPCGSGKKYKKCCMNE